ncbi:MAG: MFS transporter [Dehalococcoidia bacterium]
MTAWLGRTFYALGNRPFRVLWIGSLLTFVAFFMSTIAQSVVAFDLTGTNRAVGMVVFAQGVAQLLTAPLGGATADRFSKRMVMLLCQLAIFAVFFIIGLLIAADLITIGLLAAGSFVVGMSFSFVGPSRQAYVAEVVEPYRRGNAVALNQVALNASRVVGPLLGGAMIAIAWSGTAGAYFGMAALYGLAILSLLWLPATRARAGNGRSVFGDIADGVRYVAHHPQLRVLLPFFALVMMVGFPYVTVLPGYVENQLGYHAGVISVLAGTSAAGGLAAALIVAGFADSPRALTIYSIAGAVFGAGLLATAVAPSLWSAMVTMFAVGVGTGGFQTLNGAVILKLTDVTYYGRVMSLTMLAFAGFGLMALPIGVIADLAGERVILAIMGATVIGIVALLSGVMVKVDAATRLARASAAPAEGG